MKFRDLLSFIEASTTNGVSFDELKHEFGDDEENEDLHRVLGSALDLKEIKKEGKGRGTRYYGINFEVVVIKPNVIEKVADESKIIDGNIDVSKCLNVKEKIKTILNSTHPLSKPYKFSYREVLTGSENGRDLHDFILGGIKDIDCGLSYDFKTKKNIIYSKTERTINNSLWMGCVDGEWVIKKIFNTFVDRPEIITFKNFHEFEKILKTNFK